MCFGKKPEDPESRRNEEIEKSIRNDRRKQEREVKLLLLGRHANRHHKATRLTRYDHRCRRKWQVDSVEADASDTRRRLQQDRTKTMALHHLQQPGVGLPDHLCCNVRAGDRLRGRRQFGMPARTCAKFATLTNLLRNLPNISAQTRKSGLKKPCPRNASQRSTACGQTKEYSSPY
jgi:hypothetical protein